MSDCLTILATRLQGLPTSQFVLTPRRLMTYYRHDLALLACLEYRRRRRRRRILFDLVFLEEDKTTK